ncbi:S-layer homology domain-containing protein [Wukongibacter baidiensis]|uniref:S-layer homology domain-containing protein n=1 Tax=Wukongibacter baidiensis TaxID=1723361 RepID=UPI003D7F8860
MKKLILVLLLILSLTTQSFAGINVEVEVDEDAEVKVKIDSNYEREPISIMVYDDDRKYYIDQDVTYKDGSAEFYFKLEEDEEYDAKVNINGRQKKFSISTEEILLDETVYVYIKGHEDVILSKTEVGIEEDDTLIDVLKRVLEEEDINYKIKSGYVKSIDGLAEYDLGAKSGWMFSINDEFPEIGADSIEVEDGDYIKWLYTTDLGADIGALNPNITPEDELEETLERARAFLKSSKFTEKDIIEVISDIIELIEENFLEVNTRKDAEVLVDYTDETLRIVEAAVEKIESRKYLERTIEILESLSEFLTEPLEFIKEERMKNEVREDASKIITILLNVTSEMKDIKKLDDEIEEIIDSVAEVVSDLDGEKKLEIKESLGDEDEIEINFPKEILESIWEEGIERLEINTEIASFNIESDTFNISDRKQDIQIKLREEKDITNENQNNIVDIEIMIDGDQVYNLHKPIEVRIPYSVNGQDYGNIDVFLLKDDETKEIIAGKYDTLTESIKFISSELGKYTFSVPEKPKKKFFDLDNHSWAKEAVNVMIAKGVVNGRSDTEFDPDSEITRAEFATLIIRMLEYEINDNISIPFEDVDKNSWYYKYVAAAYKNGLINGREETKFDPNGNITRQEMAKVIAKVLENESVNVEENTELDSFEDKEDIATWAKSSAALAAKEGIITGMENGRFAPNEKANRAQAVVMLHRLYKILQAKVQ